MCQTALGGIILDVKYHLITYGCQMNTADSQEMAQPLKDRGLVATNHLQEADLVVMNTCTVREQAEHRAQSNLGRLRRWKEKNPNRILVVAGCAASRWGNDIKKRYPFIDLVSPATQMEQFPDVINQVLQERWDWRQDSEPAGRPAAEPGTAIPGSPAHPLTGAWFGSESTAYVTIMRGCNYSCSYCIVPHVRGREIYRPMTQILDEVRTKAAQGFKEVMLLGQTVNSYRWRPTVAGTPAVDFADLLRAVNEIDDVETIRFMSPHPRHMRDRVIQAVLECEKVARHFHLPVQSGSDRLLGAMKRLYTRQDYLEIVSKLRAAAPGLRITTDLIVGYPGETEEDFQETLTLLDEIRFDGLFAFKYSPRPGTTAAALADDVPGKVKEARLQRILSWAS